MQKQKQAYIGDTDRPEITVDPDLPVGQLRVRDLAAILARRPTKIHPKLEGQSPLKEFFDKPFPEILGQFGFEAAPGAQFGPDPTPWVPQLTAEPDPDPWIAHFHLLVQQMHALGGIVQRLEDQVSRLSTKVG